MNEERNTTTERAGTNVSFPVAALTVLGSLVVILGLFAAGEILVVGVGFGAIAVGGLLHVLDRR